MAKRMHVVLEDDLDGSEATQSLSFALEGVSYEIDLSDDNAQKLRDDLAVWVGHARRIAGRKTSSRAKATGVSATDIRKWAAAEGIEVKARGRVPAEVREAYEKAHA